MTKTKPKKADPAENFGIDAAREGNPEGIICFAMFLENVTMELSGFSPLPLHIKRRLAEIRKIASGLGDYASGYSDATKAKS